MFSFAKIFTFGTLALSALATPLAARDDQTSAVDTLNALHDKLTPSVAKIQDLAAHPISATDCVDALKPILADIVVDINACIDVVKVSAHVTVVADIAVALGAVLSLVLGVVGELLAIVTGDITIVIGCLGVLVEVLIALVEAVLVIVGDLVADLCVAIAVEIKVVVYVIVKLNIQAFISLFHL